MYYCDVLPELIGKWWSKRNVLENSPTSSLQAVSITIQEPAAWCYCQLEDDEVCSDLIGCDNPQCPIQWYHIACLELDYVPRGKWYCPDCKPQYKFKRSESCNLLFTALHVSKLHMLFSLESSVLYMCMGKRNNRCASIAESCTNTINESFVVSGCLLIKHADWNNTFKKLRLLFHLTNYSLQREIFHLLHCVIIASSLS